MKTYLKSAKFWAKATAAIILYLLAGSPFFESGLSFLMLLMSISLLFLAFATRSPSDKKMAKKQSRRNLPPNLTPTSDRI